ncbi:class I SAM-dependent DNA methyltransferase, partial [Campylobacter coli]|nr:class I SAM-dependent DNA methyltransferase [Campylobacter coli]
YITSNKYTRAGYGEALREFLLKNVKVLEYTDLNGIKVFDSATVDTSILCFEKSKSKDNKFKYLALSNEILKTCAYNIGLYKDFAEFSQNSLSKESFTFSDENTSALKAKIERIGTPLKEWHGLIIYRGILTGYNEAFIITTEKRNEILANCKDEAEKERTAKLIRKMLRGRDIKRYSYEWAGLWVIGTFPSLKIDIEQYPALKQYLSQFLPRIEQSGEKGCRKKTSNKWFETQDNIAYYEEFEKEILVWKAVGRNLAFALTEKNTLVSAPSSFISADANLLKYFCGILLSHVLKWLILQISDTTGAGDLMLNNQSLERLSIPKINSKNEKIADELINLVDEILKAKEQDKNASTQELENKINSLTYKLYNLTEDEIKIIENKEQKWKI